MGLGLVSGACGADRDVDSTSQTGDPPGMEAGRTDGGSAVLPKPPRTRGGYCDPFDGGTVDLGPFAEFAVGHDEVGRRLIYSWTTAEQIDELRADPTLLTRSMTSDGLRGRAADWILSRAATDEMAAILTRPEFENKRFGWTNPWATLLGWGESETYGGELLAITLRDEALIGRVDTLTGQWAFFDVENRPVSLDVVKASPERIAAVYFVDELREGGCHGSFFGGDPFREYFVCNEAMIASWSAYTQELLDELSQGLSAIRTLRTALADAGCAYPLASYACWAEDVIAGWSGAPRTLREGYESSLAFPNREYFPAVENLDRLEAALEQALFSPAPLTHTYP